MKYHNRDIYTTNETENEYGSIVKYFVSRAEISIEGAYQYKSIEIEYNTPNARVAITRTRRYSMNLTKMRYQIESVFSIEIILNMDKDTQDCYTLGNVATLKECLVFACKVLPQFGDEE